VRRILDRAGANTLGAVLNKLDDRADGYYSSRYRYYNYYYSKDHSTSEVVEAGSAKDEVAAHSRS